MEIDNLELFHIAKQPSNYQPWAEGDEIDWGNRDNLFTRNLFSSDLRYPDPTHGPTSYRKAYESLLQKSLAEKNSQLFSYFDFSNYALNKTSMMLREIVLESYRKNHKPELPSRWNCIWLCSGEGVDYWVNALQISDYKVYRVQVSGACHVSLDEHLYSDILNVDQYFEMAQRYWKGQASISPDSEIIFNGKLTVLEAK